MTKDEIFLLLYVDDGALPFVSRGDTILGTNISFETMARLGLNMHIGTKNKASKTEAVYFPSRTKIITWLKEHDEKLLPSPEDSTLMVDPSKKVRKRTFQQHKHVIDRCYVKADETKKYIVNKNEYVSLCLIFFIFRSWTSYDLNDEHDIKARIKKTNNAMGALNIFGAL